MIPVLKGDQVLKGLDYVLKGNVASEGAIQLKNKSYYYISFPSKEDYFLKLAKRKRQGFQSNWHFAVQII